MTARSFRIESTVCGHHVYNDQWTPSIGEELQTTREMTNAHGLFAVAVTKEIMLDKILQRYEDSTGIFGEEQHNYMQSY